MKHLHQVWIIFVCVTLVLSCGEQPEEQELLGPAIEWNAECEDFAERFLQKLSPDYNPKDILSHSRYCFKTMAKLFKGQELSLGERKALASLCLMSGIEFKQSQLQYDGLLDEEGKRRLNQTCINEIAAMGVPAESVCLALIRAIAPLKEGKYKEKFPYVLTGYYAIFVLQHMKSRDAVPILIDIASGNLVLRGPAGRALGLIGDPRGLPVLRKLERDRNERVRREARNAILRIEQMHGETPLKNDVVTSPTET
jgi:hypothetical protein